MANQPQTSSRTRHTFSGAADSQHFEHEVLEVARVVRVVKGGRRFRFRATVIVGDKQGTVGFGTGKSRDVQQAIQKAQEAANKSTVTIGITDGTIAHQIVAKHKGATVMLKPARPGTGVIAGGTVRTVADMAGIKDLIGKRYGSPNRISNVKATSKALQAVSNEKSMAKAKKRSKAQSKVEDK